MQFLLSSLPFPWSLMQFLVIALQGELLMTPQTWRNMLLTFPHPSVPGRETLGFLWPSVQSCKPPKDLCSVTWKKAGPHGPLKIVAYGELSLFKISPLAVCIYTRMGWTAELHPKRACSSSVDSNGSFASRASAAAYTAEVWSSQRPVLSQNVLPRQPSQSQPCTGIMLSVCFVFL